MIRNRLLPTHIFAMTMMGVSLFLLIVAWLFHQEVSAYPSFENNIARQFRNASVLAGVAIIVLCIGLLTLQKWAIWGFRAILWMGGIALTWGINEVVEQLNNEVNALKVLTGFSILLYTLLLAGILFLNNAQVLALFNGKQELKEDRPDVLDRF